MFCYCQCNVSDQKNDVKDPRKPQSMLLGIIKMVLPPDQCMRRQSMDLTIICSKYGTLHDDNCNACL